MDIYCGGPGRLARLGGGRFLFLYLKVGRLFHGCLCDLGVISLGTLFSFWGTWWRVGAAGFPDVIRL